MTFQCPENCGECCCVQPLNTQLVNANKDKFAVEPIKIDSNYFVTVVHTQDNKCIFLDRGNMKCNIYEQRPQICKEFGPSSKQIMLRCKYYNKNGKPLTEKQKAKIEEKITNAKEMIQKIFGDVK